MRQCANAHKIHACQGVIAQRVDGYATRTLNLHLPVAFLPFADGLYRLCGVLGRIVVEHDPVGYTCAECFCELGIVTHFDLNPEVLAFGLAVVACTGQCGGYASGKIHMVILEQDHVEQPYAVVHASAECHSFFLEVSQSRCRLACIQHVALCVGYQALVAVCGGGYAGHTLHDVQHRALNLQQTELLAIHAEGYVAFLHVVAVVQELLEAALGVEVVDDLLGYLHAGEYAFLLDDKLLAALCIGRDAAERGVVAVANIFVKPYCNQFAQTFFFHNCNSF